MIQRQTLLCCFSAPRREQIAPSSLQSGFAVTLSLRGASWREAQLLSKWPGSLSVGSLSAHTEAGDVWCATRGCKGRWQKGIAGTQRRKVRTGDNNTSSESEEDNCWHKSGWCLEYGVFTRDRWFSNQMSSIPRGIDECLSWLCLRCVYQDRWGLANQTSVDLKPEKRTAYQSKQETKL